MAELERLAALKEEERDAAAERAVADKGMTHNGSWKIAAVGGRDRARSTRARAVHGSCPPLRLPLLAPGRQTAGVS